MNEENYKKLEKIAASGEVSARLIMKYNDLVWYNQEIYEMETRREKLYEEAHALADPIAKYKLKAEKLEEEIEEALKLYLEETE